jgi:MFS family permease
MGESARRGTSRIHLPRGLAASDTFGPLARPVFRALWIAVLLGNIGNWMETVGAQWLLVGQPGSSTLVALVQTADTLPVMLVALPAGVLADVFDRRLLLIATQVFLAAVEVVLTLVTATGQITPGLLLLLTFLGGAGSGVTAPAWQALIPDLVDRSQLRSAAVLGSVSINLARAVGPALAGIIIAWVGVAPVFGLNAVTYLVFAGVLVWARVDRPPASMRRERLLPALRAGGAYVRWSPYVRTVLIRAALFLVPAMATWALLPLIAVDELHLDAAGYGLLLGALGVGAILGVILLGRFRARASDEALVRASSLAYAATMATLVLVPNVVVAILALLVAGACWLAVLSTINASLQLFLPGWVRARGLAIYIVVFFGSQAAGAAVWGVVAQRVGLTSAFLVAAVVMIGAAAAGSRLRLADVSGLDRSPAVYWPDARLAFQPDLDTGPVLVRVDYDVAPANVEPFLETMRALERSRRRTGAESWRLYRDGADPSRFVELFEVASWDAHLRQHGGRMTGTDAKTEARVEALATGPSVVHHYFDAEAVADPVPGDSSKA